MSDEGEIEVEALVEPSREPESVVLLVVGWLGLVPMSPWPFSWLVAEVVLLFVLLVELGPGRSSRIPEVITDALTGLPVPGVAARRLGDAGAGGGGAVVVSSVGPAAVPAGAIVAVGVGVGAAVGVGVGAGAGVGAAAGSGGGGGGGVVGSGGAPDDVLTSRAVRSAPVTTAAGCTMCCAVPLAQCSRGAISVSVWLTGSDELPYMWARMDPSSVVPCRLWYSSLPGYMAT